MATPATVIAIATNTSSGFIGISWPLSKSATAFCLDVSEWSLLFFGILLVIGIIGEYRVPWWSTRLKYFEALVVIGVAGELIADGGVFATSRRLQAISDREVADVNVEARKATEQASIADATAKGYQAQIEEYKSRVKIAEASVKHAVADVELAKATVKGADARIEEARRDAALANRTAEHERLLRAQLETIVLARDLNEQQINRLVTSWRPFAGRAVTVRSLNDADAARLAMLIRGALQTAGITAEDGGIGRLMVVGMPWTGLSVDGPQAQQDLVLALRDSLLREHILQVPPGPPAQAGDPVTITVGVKPLAVPITHETPAH